MATNQPHTETLQGEALPTASKSVTKATGSANIGAKMQSLPFSQAGGTPRKLEHNPGQAQFGQPSPLRNPLFDSSAALYNPLRGPPKKKPVNRPGEQFVTSTQSHQRSNGAPSSYSTKLPHKASIVHDADDWQDPAFQTAISTLQAEMQRPQQTVFEIRPPANKSTYNTLPPPRPMFFSGQQRASKSNVPQNNSKTAETGSQNNGAADEGDGEDNDFDPDAALASVDNCFGAPDPMMYVDADRASENIKHLIEGAFDDAADRSQIPLKQRQRSVKNSAEDTQSKKLADKLTALSIVQSEEKTQHDDSDDADDGSVEGLTVRLLPHQVEGVSWMIDKESGKKKNGIVPRGGILADDMGLGKTVQSVALMLLNPRPASGTQKEHPKQKLPGEHVGKSTLIVAPLALIRQWEGEIQSKIKKKYAMRVLVHHGSSRTKSSELLKKNDVVITTYQILASEHAASDMSRPDGPKVGCFGVHWYRIILDEAHSIKNRNAKSTLACCALESWYRWCLTGTPMQNNLDELQSLIRFLRVKPYCELPAWKGHITQPMRSGRGGLAMARLHHFLKAIMKRRTKDILKKDGALNFGGKSSDGKQESSGGLRIVKREIVTINCNFNTQEQQFYDRLSDRAQQRLNDMILDGGKTDYIGALVLLLRLRQACNHPALIDMAASKSGLDIKDVEMATPRTSKVAEADVDALADMFGNVTVNNRVCDICGIALHGQAAQDSQAVCQDCEKDMSTLLDDTSRTETITERTKVIGGSQRKGHRIVIDSDDDQDSSSENEAHSTPPPRSMHRSDRQQPQSSTKIDQILDILEAESVHHKTIIFSQFTSMLDLIQPHIQQRFVRYDGSMRPDEREAALQSLRTNPKTRVLLCSLKCGSLGLNLTAASRVIIVEPFWNPFVEEQAIDRVHRLNQTVDVKVYRLTVNDTVEERIVALQEKKRELAAAAIEGGKAIGKLSMEDIMGLFRADSQSAEIVRANAAFAEKFGKDSRLIDGPGGSPKKKDRQEGTEASSNAYRRPAVDSRQAVEHQIYGRRW